MRFKVIVMPSAEEDIKGIIRYISADLQNPKAALEHFELFNEALKSLEMMSKRNPISKLDVLRQRHLRLLPMGNYDAIYRVFEDSSTVEVYRVLYGRMDLEKEMGFE